MNFKIESPYRPTGDQPEAIEQICSAFNSGIESATLLGVTGSGKTFTMANVIEKLQRPALISVTKRLFAAQLYGEFSHFFLTSSGIFRELYDYYQPRLISNHRYIHRKRFEHQLTRLKNFV